MSLARIAIVGCGYTGRRVARRLFEAGHQVIATARNVERLRGICSVTLAVDAEQADTLDALFTWIDSDTIVLYSLPTVGSNDLTAMIAARLQKARRIVYLSTTGVYGAQRDVNEATAPAPRTERERLRVSAEQAIAAVCPSTLVLRPAAIYGPDRGIHTAIANGTFRLSGDGANFVSRIHVEDLATHCVAALLTNITGAWPVADEEPCTSREIAAFCAGLLGVPFPQTAENRDLGETRRADRRVDGSAIRRALDMQLRFPQLPRGDSRLHGRGSFGRGSC